MKKTTKGALAAGSAAVLLMGGAGTLAFWTDTATAEGTDIKSGHLKLVDLDDCSDDWMIDGDPNPVAFDSETDLLVPGDTLTMSCTYTLDIAGTHLSEVDFDVSLPSDVDGAGALEDELNVQTAVALNGVPRGDGTNVEVEDDDEVTVDITITWPYGVVEDNDSNVDTGLSAALSDLTVTVTQNHDNS